MERSGSAAEPILRGRTTGSFPRAVPTPAKASMRPPFARCARRPASGHKSSKTAKGWKGQKQIWFAFAFQGEDREIDLAAHGEVEFDSWRWADLDAALADVVDFKRATYCKVISAFRRFTRSPAARERP